MRKFLFALFLFYAVNAKAQSVDSTGYYTQMNNLFSLLNKSLITTGFLKDYAIEFNNWDNFTGTTLHDSNFVSLGEWRFLYAGLYSSRITNTSMLYLDTINRLLYKNSNATDPVSMAVLYYNYQTFKPTAISANLITYTNGKFNDVPGRTQSPYDSKEMFAVAPIRQGVLVGNAQFIFRSTLLLGNTGKTISSIQVDPKGTGVWQTVSLNTMFSVNYTAEGFYPFNTRINYSDGTQRMSHTKIAVYEQPAGLVTKTTTFTKKSSLAALERLRLSPEFFGDNPRAPEAITATKLYQGSAARGQMIIELSRFNTTGQIRRPLIVVEGFDLNNTYNYREFTTSITRDGNTGALIGLNNELDDVENYDVIFLNFNNATDYIQRNAYLLEEAIRQVNLRKQPFNGVRQQNVIVGLSMGGVMARYALRDMEVNNLAHETRALIAHDSPFKGANIPVSFQAAVQHLSRFKLLGIGTNGFLAYNDLFPEIATLLTAFNSPAAKQLIIQRYDLTVSTGALTANNTAYNAFQSELNTLGWPVNCRNFLLSNGSCNGTRVFTGSNLAFFSLSGSRGFTYFGALWRSLVLRFAGLVVATGVVTGDGIQPNGLATFFEFSLAPLSTKTSLNIDFTCRSIPNSGTAQIYRGNISSRKKILFVVDVTTNFINLTCNSSTSMTPLDNAPGGVYDMREFGIDPAVIQSQLPSFFQFATASIPQAQFCFVPTVSSVALNNHTAAWFNSICADWECQTPGQLFDVYLQNTNQFHISYTAANSTWLTDHIDPLFNCPKFCPSALVINGPASFCTSQAYSLAGLPGNATVTWSVSPTGRVTLSPNGINVTLTRTANGSITLTATISSPCFSNIPVTKSVYIGGPTVPTITILGIAPLPNTQMDVQVTANVPGPYLWYVDNVLSRTVTTNVTTLNGGGCGDHTLKVEVSNSCGTNSASTTYLRRCTAFSIAPNPTSDMITVTASDEGAVSRSAIDVSFSQIEVRDKLGTLVKNQTYPTGTKKATLSLASLPPDTYVLRVLTADGWDEQQIIVR
jgi:hypothetical protein